MGTAEPSRADDAGPGAGEGTRVNADPGHTRATGTSSGTDTRLRRSAARCNRHDRKPAGPPGGSDTAEPGTRAAAPPPATTAEPARPDAPATGTDEPSPDAPTGPAARERMRRVLRHPVTLVTALAAALHVAWFFTFANGGGDLAAQDAWAEFVGRHPDSAYNLAWYGGMHPVSYSIVSPYLMSVLGVRTTIMAAGTVSAGLLTLMLMRSRAVRRPLPPALAGVFGLLCNTVSGRVTFGLGTVFGLAAVATVFCWPYRWRRKRWAKALVAAPLAGLATAASPVAGLFVGLVAVALFLQRRRPGAYALGVAPSLVVGLSAWLFPFSGTQPMTILSVLGPLSCAVVIFLVAPREWRTVRFTSAVYALAVVLAWAISSQIGSNITRLAMLFAGVVLLTALPFAEPRSRKWYVTLAATAGYGIWIMAHTVNDVVHTTPAASWARELAPLVHQLQTVGAERGRVEVVPARSHREASALAPYVNLARGWNRQADMERNPLFYDDTLNSANYHEWLRRWAVHYVVLPKDEPDGDGGLRERQLVQRGQPYLKQIWGDANWQLFEVTDPLPLATPPAVVDRAEQGEMTIEVKKPGRVLIRVPYSPWLSIVDADGKGVELPQETEESQRRGGDGPKEYVNRYGCLRETEPDAAGDQWTELLAPRAGVYRLAAPYQLPRGTPCPKDMQ